MKLDDFTGIGINGTVEIKKIGYVLDQTAYKLNRIVLDNEEIITKMEYKEFQNFNEEKKIDRRKCEAK